MRTKKFAIKFDLAVADNKNKEKTTWVWLVGLTKDNALCIGGPSSDNAKIFYDLPDALAFWNTAFPDMPFNEDYVSIVDVTERRLL